MTRDETSAVGMTIRELSVTALAPKTHGLDTLMLGPDIDGVPGFVVVVEPSGPPTTLGFGRIVSVKPCDGVDALIDRLDEGSVKLETLGVAGDVDAPSRRRLDLAFLRVCQLGEMQRPPFGHRPTVEDFA